MTVRFPITSEIGGDLIGMVLDELRLCKVNRQESVVLFSDTRTNPNYVSAFLAAGKELAKSIFEIKIPFLPQGGGKSIDLAPVIKILKNADFVVDLSTGSVLYLYGKGLTRSLVGGHASTASQSQRGAVAPLLSNRRIARANFERR